MKILNFGSCNIDYVYSLDHIVRVGETETTQKMEIFPGGKGLNQSIAVARAGAPVYHAGCVGSDGEMLKELLAVNGVDVSYIKTVDEKNGNSKFLPFFYFVLFKSCFRFSRLTLFICLSKSPF
jgi:ribokinase